MGEQQWVAKVLSSEAVDRADILSHLHRAYERVAWGRFQGAEGRDIRVASLQQLGLPDEEGGRKRLSYFAWCRQAGDAGRMPGYLARAPRAAHRLAVNLCRFRLGSTRLRVATGAWADVPWLQRYCHRCDAEGRPRVPLWVDDEHHLIFGCSAFEEVRESVPGARAAIDRAQGSVRAFLADENESAVMAYVSQCMDMVDALHTDP